MKREVEAMTNEELRIKAAELIWHDELSDITEETMENILANPVYAGIGPYPAIVDEETWVAAVVQFISEVGAEKYVRLLLSALRSSFAEEPGNE